MGMQKQHLMSRRERTCTGEVASGRRRSNQGRWRDSCVEPPAGRHKSTMANEQESRVARRDAALLLRLSGIHAALLKSEQAAAGLRTSLRQQQLEVLHLDTAL